jgi:ribosomal protein S18 acetylase RimI-like enzyme
MNRLDPNFQLKLQELIERGLTPDQILSSFQEDDINKAISLESRSDSPIQSIPDEIKIISKPLAYRPPENSDLASILRIINDSYFPEVEGEESFRIGNYITKDNLETLIKDCDYEWLLVESTDTDRPIILGISCFSTIGTSRRNGIVEGKLGSIRIFCIDPAFQHLMVGKRLLIRIEKAMKEAGCVRMMFSIPCTRIRLQRWLEKQEFYWIASTEYPTMILHHQLKDGIHMTLELYSKSLCDSKIQSCDSKESDIEMKNTNSDISTNTKMCLPLIWRIHNNDAFNKMIIPKSENQEHCIDTNDEFDLGID